MDSKNQTAAPRSNDYAKRAEHWHREALLIADKTRTLKEKFEARGWRVLGDLSALKLKGKNDATKR